MPKLPDVERFKRYVGSTSLHHRIKKVELDAPRMLRVAPAAASAQRWKMPALRRRLAAKAFIRTYRLFLPALPAVGGTKIVRVSMRSGSQTVSSKDSNEPPLTSRHLPHLSKRGIHIARVTGTAHHHKRSPAKT